MLHAARLVGLPAILAAALFGATRISEVDFKNFNYAWDAPGDGVPGTWKWLEGKPKSTLQVAGGRHDFSESEPTADGYVLVWSVKYGDLNGDGQEEAVVDLFYSTGGTANWHYLYVFAVENGLPKLLGRLESGSRADGGLVRVAVQQNTLVLDFADPKRRIADCCSEGYVRVTYRWHAGRFVGAGHRTSGDLKIEGR